MTLDSLLLLVYSQLLHMPCELAVAGQQLALASQQLVCHTGLELVLR